MLDYMRVTPEGDPCVDLSTLTREHASALSDFTVEDSTDGRGEEARNVRRVKIKLHDKIGALVQLGKYLGLFAEKSAVPTSPLEEVPTELLLEMRNELLQRRAKLIGTGGG
jgi:phage terminase small subunit